MRRDTLLVATVGYLLLPNVVFVLGWLRPAWGYGIALVAVACLVDVVGRARTDRPPLSGLDWAVVLALAAFWVVAGGIGELNAQVWDYTKHNLVFHDLIVEPWPVVYRAPDLHDPMLCYYLAYYLPTALVAKLLGIQYAASASLAWGSAGVVLAFAWVARLGRPNGPAVLCLFTLVDGLCWVPGLVALARRLAPEAGALRGGWWQTDGFTDTFFHLAGVHTRLMFQSEPWMLVWTPQHALGAWLATACVLSVVWERRTARYCAFVNAALMLWSPFVAIGLLPFTVAVLWRRWRRELSWVDALGALALAVPVGIYLQAHEPQRFAGLLFAALPNAAAWSKYLLFLLLAIGSVWAAVWLVQHRYTLLDVARWRVFCLAGAALVATTLVYMGKYNDWAMRVSMPSLFVLHLTAAAVAVTFWRSRAALRHRLALAALLLLTAERPIKTYILMPMGRAGSQGIPTTISTARRAANGLVRFQGGDDPDITSQYLGSTDSWFGQHLMRVRAAGTSSSGSGRTK
ncbi:MAG: hypothetical protein LAO05_11535 [Acidobacteriia bacterium]|nr:hypothetical protein [Terriglobia bacterium]